MTELTALEERDMDRAIKRLIKDERLTGEDADIAYAQWERAGYAYVMDARLYGARKAERDYNRAYKERKRAEKQALACGEE